MIRPERKCDECAKIIADDALVLRVKAGVMRAKNERGMSGGLGSVADPTSMDDAEVCSEGCAVTRFRRVVLGERLNPQVQVVLDRAEVNTIRPKDILEVR